MIPGVRFLDRLAGLALGLVAGVFLCWAIGAVLLYVPGETELRRSVQRSTILSEINEVFPPERLLEELERVDPIGVFLGPPAIVAPPERGVARDPDVVRASKQRRARHRDRVRPRRRGLRLGRGARARRHERARRRGNPDPRVDTPAGGPSARRSSPSTRRTTSPSCGSPGSARGRCRLADPERERPRRARRLSEKRPAHADAGTARRDGAGPQPRRVRGGADQTADHGDSRRRRARAAPAARGSTGRGACARRSSRGGHARRAATASPPTSCGERSRAPARSRLRRPIARRSPRARQASPYANRSSAACGCRNGGMT